MSTLFAGSQSPSPLSFHLLGGFFSWQFSVSACGLIFVCVWGGGVLSTQAHIGWWAIIPFPCHPSTPILWYPHTTTQFNKPFTGTSPILDSSLPHSHNEFSLKTVSQTDKWLNEHARGGTRRFTHPLPGTFSGRDTVCPGEHESYKLRYEPPIFDGTKAKLYPQRIG